MTRRVLHIITGLSCGGAELLLLDVAARMPKHGWEVKVLCLRKPELVERFRSKGIDTHALGSTKWNPTSLWRLLRHVEAFQPSIIHAHLFEAEVFAGIIKILRPRIPLVSTRHGLDPLRNAIPAIFIQKILTRLQARIVGVSNAVVASIPVTSSMKADKLMLIHNGVNTKMFSPGRTEEAELLRKELGLGGKKVVGSVGRLVPEKGYDFLLTAWPAVLDQVPEACLLLIGDGPQRALLQKMVSGKNMRGSVRLCGTITEALPTWLLSFDLFVLPSLSEGLGIAVLEAMASGLPVVATHVGGIPDIVNSSSGILVPAGDVKALAAAIVQTLDNPLQSKNMGREARNRVEREFTIEHTVEKLAELYEAVLGER